MSVFAQMIVVESPLNNASSSFYERNGVGFNFSLPGSGRVVGLGPDGQPTADGAIPFRFGGLGPLPPFGGYDPSADSTLGFGFRGSNGGGFGLNFAFGQGASRTYTSTNPMVVITNGTTGSVSDTSQRPFVTSIVPVLGDDASELMDKDGARLAPTSTAANRAASRSSSLSTAETGDLSVMELRRQRQDRESQKIDALLAKARLAVQQKKYASAKIFYRNALRSAAGSNRHSELLTEYEAFVKNQE